MKSWALFDPSVNMIMIIMLARMYTRISTVMTKMFLRKHRNYLQCLLQLKKHIPEISEPDDDTAEGADTTDESTTRNKIKVGNMYYECGKCDPPLLIKTNGEFENNTKSHHKN